MTNATTVDYEPVPTPDQPPKPSPALMFKLSAMMFLEFAIQGAWLPLLFPFFKYHRNFPDAQVGYLGAIGAVGAIASPLVAGQLADRKMNAERVLGISHILGALLVLRMAYATGFTELMIEAFLYGLLYTPTLALVNAISFRHLPDRDRDFGKVRVWGTIGWITIGIAVGQWLFRRAGTDLPLQYEYMGDAFRISAFIGLFFGVFSFFLPRTPPEIVAEETRRTGADPREPGRTPDYAPQPKSKFAPGEAMREIVRARPLLVLFLLAFPIATVHSLFFARAAEYLGSGRVQLPNPDFINNVFGVGGAGLMTIGQMSEVIVLALMPFFAKRFSKKVLLTVGLLAYALRFFAFAYLPYGWAILPALALHGLVFGCFFFLVFMIIDEHTTKDVRSSAQNLFNFIIFGVGVIAGNTLAGWIGEASTSPTGQLNWTRFMSIPMWITLACLVAFLVAYPNRSRILNKEGLVAS
jgi:MFS family permease